MVAGLALLAVAHTWLRPASGGALARGQRRLQPERLGGGLGRPHAADRPGPPVRRQHLLPGAADARLLRAAHPAGGAGDSSRMARRASCGDVST